MSVRSSSGRSKALSAAIAAILSPGAPLVAYAAEVARPLDTVTVTATRRDESIQDVPLNITAVGAEEISVQRLTSLTDLGRTVPGLFLVDQGPRASNLIAVRGLNANALAASEGLGNSGGGTVSTYVGDIPLYVDLKLLDIQRVEALFGPQGTLYGAGTLAGAIRYIPNPPDASEQLLTVGTRAFTRAESSGLGTDSQLVFNTPLIDDKLAFRVALNYVDDPGFIDYDYLVRQPGVSNPQPDFSDPADVEANLRREKDADWERTLSGRASLLWHASDSVDVTLTYFYQNQDVGGRTVNHVDAFGTGRYVSAHRYPEPNERENQLLALEVSADLGFAELTSATGISKYDELGQRDQTDLLLSFEYGYEEFPSFSSYTREVSDEETLTQELRLVSTSDGPLQWIVGAFYNHFDIDAVSEEFTPGFPQFAGIDRPDNLEYIQVAEAEATETALFGEIGYDITDAWQVVVGGRWFEFDTEQNVGFDLPLLSGDPTGIALISQQNSAQDDGTIFKFNTSYRFTRDLMGYVTVSEGYRTGGANAVPTCEDPLPPGQNVCALPNEVLIAPDSTTNYELGMRSTWLNGAMTLNASVFHVDWEDIQVSGVTQNGQVPITVNGAEARSRGLELSLQADLSEQWNLSLGYSYTDAELSARAPGIVNEADSDPTSPTYDGAERGDRLPGSPQHQGSLRVGYSQVLQNGMDLQAHYQLAAVGDVYTKAGLRNSGEVLPGYALHGIDVGLVADRWSARLYADNVFNKYAETSVRSDSSFIYAVGSNDFALRRYYKGMVRPRTIGIDLNYRFDL